MSKCKSTISPLIILCIQMVAAEKLKKHSNYLLSMQRQVSLGGGNTKERENPTAVQSALLSLMEVERKAMNGAEATCLSVRRAQQITLTEHKSQR